MYRDEVENGKCVAVTQAGWRCGREAAIELPWGGVCHRHIDDLEQFFRERIQRRFLDRCGIVPDEYLAPDELAARKRAQRRAKVVYYVRQGDYIKIGYASNLRQRIRGISESRNTRPADLETGPVELLATHLGGVEAESAMHELFKHLRVSGEWFQAAPELLDHIARVNARRESPAA